MRLIEAILDANRRALNGDVKATLDASGFAASLPVVALTCIDPRLNRLLPDFLGIRESDFIWLRNAGNIIFSSTSTMMRTLALACAIKEGKEIIILGHTDCRVRQTTVLELTERFKALGIQRNALPDDLTDFFGLFASERQNVIRAVEFARRSPLIGPNVPVHGMLINVETGGLEWVVNGYDAVGASGVGMPGPQTVGPTSSDLRIGAAAAPVGSPSQTPPPPVRETAPPPIPQTRPTVSKKRPNAPRR